MAEMTQEEYEQVYASLEARARTDVRRLAQQLRKLEARLPGTLAEVAAVDADMQAHRLRRRGEQLAFPRNPLITEAMGRYTVTVQVAEIGWPVVEETATIEHPAKVTSRPGPSDGSLGALVMTRV